MFSQEEPKLEAVGGCRCFTALEGEGRSQQSNTVAMPRDRKPKQLDNGHARHLTHGVAAMAQVRQIEAV